MSVKDKRRLVISILLIGFICVSMVVMRAYAAEVRCENNRLNDINEQLASDIDTLAVKISFANSAGTIEEIAKERLGMEYPTADNCQTLKDSDKPKKNFAAVIRKEAYN
jgi:cell division protein FtsL